MEVYQRSLRTPAPFDAWLSGDDAAMTEMQKSGLKRCIDIDCAGCHCGKLMGAESVQKFGLIADYGEHTGSDEPHHGLVTLTGEIPAHFAVP